MLDNPEQVVTFLLNLSLFTSLDEAQVRYVSSLTSTVHMNPEDEILSQGKMADGFYIILNGQAKVERWLSRENVQVDVFVSGDYFGEDSLIKNQPEPGSVSALGEVDLLHIDRKVFLGLLKEFPDLADRLKRSIKTHDFLKRLKISWLGDQEVIYQVRQKHVAFLFVSLLIPAVLLLIGALMAALFGIAWTAGNMPVALAIGAAILLGLGVGWGLWNWADWGNDLYFVTSQRVAWIEKVIALYDSRFEAPWGYILAVDVNTNFLGRLLGYGDVIVSTYTGKIILRAVNNPIQLYSLISEYWQRYQVNLQDNDQKDLRLSVKGIVSGEKQAETRKVMRPGAKAFERRKPDEVKEQSLMDRYFSHIFQTRIEDGKTITYRKHWLILLKKTWLPGMVLLVLIAAIAYFDIMSVLNQKGLYSLLVVTVLGLLVFAIIFLWWMYHYVDWRNDIYQVTDRSIFDIERKPFGSESRKSAPLENILSLEHQRPGFIGYVLNVGYVTINVGETKFTFDYVHQPARVQQDVFNRMHALKLQKQKEEVTRERDRFLKMLEIYHQETHPEEQA